MLTATILIPLVGAAFIALSGRVPERRAQQLGAAIAAVPLVLLVIAWTRFDAGSGELFQLVEEAEWIPTLGVGFRLGLDGIGLAIALTSALLFVAAIIYPVDTLGKSRQYVGWMLFLEAISLGLFLTLDLLVFYVFFDLSLVGMYFLIAIWGHENGKKAALKFFLYTLLGSLVMLLGIIGLVLATDPITFDMRDLTAQQPLAADAGRAGLVLLALVFGLAVKTPLVPVHTWLPAAHVEAPAPASTILAGVLLKMGTFGLIRIPFSMMRDTFDRYAFWLGVAAVVSILYGAFVAFGQDHLKRRIAYTSVNHMGYSVLGIAAAGMLSRGSEEARALALTGATVEMVAHGLITGALFLLAGSFWQRTHDYEIGGYGGLASRAPVLTGMTTIAAFASLGLPGLAGFVAEFQVFAGTFAVSPWLAGIGLIGILVTAALFLQLLQRLFLGEAGPLTQTFAVAGSGGRKPGGVGDLTRVEYLTVGVLLLFVVLIGVAPRLLLDLIHATSQLLVGAG